MVEHCVIGCDGFVEHFRNAFFKHIGGGVRKEEKAQARKDAIKRVHDEAYARLTQAKNKAAVKHPEIQQTTLFG